jgi:Carboxypeptidase regulatory-like domain
MPTKALQLASQITHPVTAAVFAAVLALLALVALARGKKKPPQIAWTLAVVIFLLGLAPLLSSTYLDSRGIYRVRVELLGPTGQSVHDAQITSSAGGEMKKTDSGWEFTIPPQDKPADGVVTFRASRPDAFLAGSATLKLAHDYFPEIELKLSQLPSANVRGMVEDENGRPIAGALVWVLGYDETTTTGTTGSFTLAAHASDGQQVTLLAQKKNLTAQTTAFAGRPSEIILRKH